MNRFLSIIGITLFVLSLASLGYSQQEEQLTITTYYPAPAGSYHELRVNQMSVGSGYRNTHLSDGTLIVSGDMGIGMGAPVAELDVRRVAGSSRTGWVSIIENQVSNSAGQNGLYIEIFNRSTSTTALDVYAGGGHALFVRGDGNVGIGTFDPTEKLAVAGNIKFTNSGSSIYGNSLIIYGEGNTRLVLQPSDKTEGNVGIGMTAATVPGYKLEVRGDVRIAESLGLAGYRFVVKWSGYNNPCNNACSPGRCLLAKYGPPVQYVGCDFSSGVSLMCLCYE